MVGYQSLIRRLNDGWARCRVDVSPFCQNSGLQQSQERAVFAPGPRPFGSGMPLGCSGGKSQLKGEIFFFRAARRPTGGATYATGRGFFFRAWELRFSVQTPRHYPRSVLAKSGDAYRPFLVLVSPLAGAESPEQLWDRF